MPGNHFEVLLASAARTATPSAMLRTNQDWRGMILTIHVTARTGAATLTPLLVVPNSADAYTAHTYWQAAAIAATGSFEYLIYPGAPATAGDLTEAPDGTPLPTRFAVQITHGTADSITYDCCAHYLI